MIRLLTDPASCTSFKIQELEIRIQKSGSLLVYICKMHYTGLLFKLNIVVLREVCPLLIMIDYTSPFIGLLSRLQ